MFERFVTRRLSVNRRDFWAKGDLPPYTADDIHFFFRDLNVM
jgi:hypothetical protein